MRNDTSILQVTKTETDSLSHSPSVTQLMSDGVRVRIQAVSLQSLLLFLNCLCAGRVILGDLELMEDPKQQWVLGGGRLFISCCLLLFAAFPFFLSQARSPGKFTSFSSPWGDGQRLNERTRELSSLPPSLEKFSSFISALFPQGTNP